MKLIIEGQKPLSGEIRVSGAKNAALKMIAASLIVDGKVALSNVPEIADVSNMLKIAERIGHDFIKDKNTVTLTRRSTSTYKLPTSLTSSLRGAVVFVGPLLAKHKKAVLPVPGGCAIGNRPITTHIDILGKLGVRTTKNGDNYSFEVIKRPGGNATLIEQSVTATENAIMFLSLGDSSVNLHNCALEPEIDDLINMLNQAGAKISRFGKNSIKIIGVNKLCSVDYSVMGDRVEAGTWIIAGLLLGNPLKISGFDPETLSVPIQLLKDNGAILDIEKNAVRTKQSLMNSFKITTQVYPGFPTDLQSPFGLLMTQCSGKSNINEKLFNDRLKYLDELSQMGAGIRVANSQTATIVGPTILKGKRILSTDLRAGATLVLAGLIAEGTTTVENAQIIDRGYEQIDDKLRKVGASVVRR